MKKKKKCKHCRQAEEYEEALGMFEKENLKVEKTILVALIVHLKESHCLKKGCE